MADFTKLNGYNVKDAGAGRSLSVSGSDLSLKDSNGNTLSTVQMSGGGGEFDPKEYLVNITPEALPINNAVIYDYYASDKKLLNGAIIDHSLLMYTCKAVRSGADFDTSTLVQAGGSYNVPAGAEVYLVFQSQNPNHNYMYGIMTEDNGQPELITIPYSRILGASNMSIITGNDSTKSVSIRHLDKHGIPDILTMNQCSGYYKNNTYIKRGNPRNDDLDILGGKLYVETNQSISVSSKFIILKSWGYIKVKNNTGSAIPVSDTLEICVVPIARDQSRLTYYTKSGSNVTLTGGYAVKDSTPYLS